ncbi:MULTISPECIES: hypothetical protein [Streptomyces]|uniref:hypothetical protein n=1 Tax=Streptomyces TaxID=1883 RepID=UPI001E4F2237|nr:MULTISPECIES: hypothetical protein [Streptomyces]UFQ15658.1 hypothetical protein J2N69_12000 [Streptomyces huasconensis]WCL85261.1 hypothetical protein PPN52_12010 [Streptomyces sp. JCM 35825]
MAARARKSAATPRAKKCPDCKGKGETTETVRVGARKGRATTDEQTALCLTCWGSGEAPTT